MLTFVSKVCLRPVLSWRGRRTWTSIYSRNCCGHFTFHKWQFSTLKTLVGEQKQVTETFPTEQVLLNFSATLREKLTPNRINRLQKIFNDSQSPFFSEMAEVRNISELLDVVEKHATEEKFEVVDVVAACDIIFLLLKDEKSVSRRREMNNSVGMQKFWKIMRRKCRSMDGKELISALKLLSFVGVQSSDTNLQVVLRMLTKQTNTLEPGDIFYLHFILHRFPNESKSPLSAALELALPVVFESQISTSAQTGELEQESCQSLCDYLHYATRENMSDKTIKYLLSAIERVMGAVTPKQAMSILWSLGDARHNEPDQERIVLECFRIATENIDTYELTALSTTIGKATRKYLKKVEFFYNEDFVQAVCNRLMSRHNVDKDQALFTLKSISQLRHVHVEYMDRVGEIIAARPSDVLNNDYLLLLLVRAFSGCNYKPEKWPKFEAMLLNHPALIKDLGMQEFSLAVDFLALDTFPEALIQRIFSPQELPTLDKFIQKSPFHSAQTLVLLFNAVQFLYPQYSGPLPPISMIARWKDLVKQDLSKRSYPLKGALQTGFGGENYVINGIYCNGLHVDHAVVMRKGGYPIAMNSTDTDSIQTLEDIKKPAESEILLVKVFWKDAFSNNTPRLRGVMALEQRILEKMGHSFVAVDGIRWTELLDHEKIPFLMHKIREKIDKIQWNQSGSDVIPR